MKILLTLLMFTISSLSFSSVSQEEELVRKREMQQQQQQQSYHNQRGRDYTVTVEHYNGTSTRMNCNTDSTECLVSYYNHQYHYYEENPINLTEEQVEMLGTDIIIKRKTSEKCGNQRCQQQQQQQHQ